MFTTCVDEHFISEPVLEPEGKIFLDSSPRGANIFLLGTDTKKITPDSISKLESGVYSTTLKLAGYKDTTFDVNVLSNLKTTKLITLKKLEAAGILYLNSDPPGADIFFQGDSTGKITPDSILNLNAGSYEITFKKRGFLRFDFYCSNK